MKLTSTLAAALLAVSTAGSAWADPSYPTPNVVNPVTYTFHALGDGDIYAYFLSSEAAYNEVIGMTVNGVPTGITGLGNHSSAVGAPLDLGTVSAGDLITFFIYVSTTGDTWSSDWWSNTDLSNHIYSTAYSGPYPADTFISFEDLPGHSDYDYNDTAFAVSNVTTVPEPADVVLMLAGFALVSLLARRRQ